MKKIDRELIGLIAEVRALGFSFENMAQGSGVSKQAIAQMFGSLQPKTKRKGIRIVLKFLSRRKRQIDALQLRLLRELAENVEK